ncbi:MAG: gliding motility-associated C-terminal domain-containing protein [Saprospiraceae bacterium]|nr:gliding motility-associated C-terminal domain-containing protein [Candidatus Opimibacter skivensis]
MNLRYLFFFVLIWATQLPLQGQVIFVSSLSNELFRLNIEDCSLTKVCDVDLELFDISFHPNGKLYGISGDGSFFEINTVTGWTSYVTTFPTTQVYNSLAIAADQSIYATGDEGRLYSYKLGGPIQYLGDYGYSATGDLAFYKGNLYVAITDDRILQLNFNNLPASQIVVNDPVPGDIYGIVSFAEDCADTQTYAISDGDSDIYFIDFDNSRLDLVCSLNIEVGGGASTYEFNASAPIVIDAQQFVAPTCGLSDGQITISASGGIGSIMYSLDGINFMPSGHFTGLASGTYTVIVQDDNQCSVSVPFNLSTPGAPQLAIVNLSHPKCDLDNGSILLNGAGGSGALTFSIDGVTYQGTNTYTGLPAGQYAFFLRDQTNCTDSIHVELIQQHAPAWQAVDVEPTSCGQSNGSLTLNVTGSTLPLQYALNGGSFSSTNLYTNLSAGQYIVTVRDGNDCRIHDTLTINPSSRPVIQDALITAETCNQNNGSLAVIATSDTSSLMYAIDGLQYQPEHIFSSLTGGAYTIFALDSVGCSTETTVLLQAIPAGAIESLSVNHTSCGESNGNIALTISQAPGIQISLNGIPTQMTTAFSDLEPGEYVISLVDQNLCADTATALINSSEHPEIAFIDIHVDTCSESKGQIMVSATTGTTSIAYSLNGSGFQANNFFNGLMAGDYLVEVRDENGCIVSETVEVEGTPPVSFDQITIQEVTCGLHNGIIEIIPKGGSGSIRYVLNDRIAQSENRFQNLSPDTAKLTITDQIGCVADTLLKIPQSECPLYIPNIFSPNGDGVNDVFNISLHPAFLGRVETFDIFDRWGNQVYGQNENSSVGASSGWDGTYDGQFLQPGVFLYKALVYHDNGRSDLIIGDVTLVR